MERSWTPCDMLPAWKQREVLMYIQHKRGEQEEKTLSVSTLFVERQWLKDRYSFA